MRQAEKQQIREQNTDLMVLQGGEGFTEALLAWYDAHARVLPWRSEPTPYRVWISEIMLQQTRVEAVKPYFDRFVREVPSVLALAEIPDERLMKLWEGLGYYSRARNLKKAAQVIVREHGGELPHAYADLLALPGIGPYTAGAIASIAFGGARPAVDGNVVRVMTRLSAFGGDAAAAGTRQAAERLAAARLPADRAGDYNQALMELGATVCLPNGAPLCASCPLRAYCAADRLGLAAELPRKTKKKDRRVEEKTVFVITDGASFALRKRPKEGLLPELWELPNTEGRLDAGACASVLQTWGVNPAKLLPIGEAKHIFTHLEWHMTGYLVRTERIPEETGLTSASEDEIRRVYSIPTAFRPLLEAAKKTVKFP